MHSSTKDHLGVNADMLLCRFFQFSSLVTCNTAKQHAYLCFCCLLSTQNCHQGKNQALLQPIGYLYAFQSCSLCLLCFCRWPSHTRLLCPTEGEPANKTQYCWFTTANQKTPASVRKQEIMFFSKLGTKKTAWDIYATHRLDGVSSRCR